MPDKLSEELARTVLRQGEIKLREQLRAALASDQRALILAGIFTALASAALGYGISVIDGNGPAGLGALVAGCLLVVGSGCCIAAAWPVEFRFAGNRPENWWDDGVRARPLANCFEKESMNYDRGIKKNRAQMDRSTVLLGTGAAIGAASPLIGSLAAVLVWA